MEIKELIKTYDQALDFISVSKLIKFTQRMNFIHARVGEGEGLIDKKIRNVEHYILKNTHKSMTETFWYNFLTNLFQNFFLIYKNEFKLDPHFNLLHGVQTLSILKYTEGNFYTTHVDQMYKHEIDKKTRFISFILLLNNDYEGGEICFTDPDHKSNEKEIKVQPGRLIMWPSNFLYPHKVKPVTKGTRYSVVGWGIA